MKNGAIVAKVAEDRSEAEPDPPTSLDRIDIWMAMEIHALNHPRHECWPPCMRMEEEEIRMVTFRSLPQLHPSGDIDGPPWFDFGEFESILTGINHFEEAAR